MKLAFSTLGCPDYGVDEIIDAVKRYGYDAIGIRTVKGESYLPNLEEFQPGGIRETHRRFKQAGVDVVCVSSGVRFTSADRSERDKQFSDAKKYLDMAVALEAPYIRVFGGPIKPEMNEEETVNWIIEGFRKCSDEAEKRGIEVLLETHDTFSTGKKTRQLLSRVERKNIAVLWDILHSFRFGESFGETWNEVGSLIRHVHIKDSSEYSSEGFNIKLCGEGTIPIGEAVSLLRGKGYRGYFSFEWEKGWHREIPGCEEAFPHYVKYMRDLEKSLES